VTRLPAIRLCEAWARDGIQGWPLIVATADKVHILRAAIDAGFTELDATSFVPPRTSKQFADARAVLAALADRPSDVKIRVLTVNERSFDTIESFGGQEARIDFCGFPISASEAHNLANLHRTHAEHKIIIRKLISRSAAIGAQPLLSISTAFGCPISGPVKERDVMELAEWAANCGIRHLMLGDTTGMADPDHAFDLFSMVASRLPDVRLIAHFHDTRGNGVANTMAAVRAGVRTVDTSLGGCGGEPPSVIQNHQGTAGNVCTEDLLPLMQRMGFDTGIDVQKVLELGAFVEQLAGRRLRSQVLRAGIAAKRSSGD